MANIYFYYHLNKLLYVGSTFNIKKRQIKHRSNLLNEKVRLPFYNHLRENNITFDDLIFYTFQLETVDRKILTDTEGLYIRNYTPLCNIRIEGRDKKEYNKEYREINKEKIKEYNKLYRETNKEYNKEYKETNKEKIKENNKLYREANKEKKNLYNKNYREAKKINYIKKIIEN